MQERAFNLGGEASVSRSATGTTARVSVPRTLPAASQSLLDDGYYEQALPAALVAPAPSPAPGRMKKI